MDSGLVVVSAGACCSVHLVRCPEVTLLLYLVCICAVMSWIQPLRTVFDVLLPVTGKLMLFSCREIFRHNLLPKAVRYYTGEIVGEDEYDDDDDDYDEDDDEVSIVQLKSMLLCRLFKCKSVQGVAGCAYYMDSRSHQGLECPNECSQPRAAA